MTGRNGTRDVRPTNWPMDSCCHASIDFGDTDVVNVAVLVTLAAMLALPSLSQSTLSDMGYWVDWAALLGMAAGVGVAAAVLLWPVLALRKR